MPIFLLKDFMTCGKMLSEKLKCRKRVVYIRNEVWCCVSRHRWRRSVCCLVMSMIRERCQRVRVGALTTENGGELIWRINCCSLTNVEMSYSVYNGEPSNNAGRVSTLKINHFNRRDKLVEHRQACWALTNI